jgi:hypothetical protein
MDQLSLAQCRLPLKELDVKILEHTGADLMSMAALSLEPLFQQLNGRGLIIHHGCPDTTTHGLTLALAHGQATAEGSETPLAEAKTTEL